jgi:6-phosphogluconolactonase/glucosamine-6-phosphate isomerase/deaminase
MGELTAERIVESLKIRHEKGTTCGLWLMAAPSAFPFYRSFVQKAGQDGLLRAILQKTHFFQFDDYPVDRSSALFPMTFRHLLESRFFRPLEEICGRLPHIHFLELTGTDRDTGIMARYMKDLLALKSEGTHLIQLKGIGMDGHWGFHGAETPLDMAPDIIEIHMTSQNIHQQQQDWPDLFKRPADVPKTAMTFNVRAFMTADEIIDNVPQQAKEYAVLAAYGTDEISNEIPSSALKNHPKAQAYLTRPSARALIEFKADRQVNPEAKLTEATLTRLEKIWDDPDHPAVSAENVGIMKKVLKQLGMMAE